MDVRDFALGCPRVFVSVRRLSQEDRLVPPLEEAWLKVETIGLAAHLLIEEGDDLLLHLLPGKLIELSVGNWMYPNPRPASIAPLEPVEQGGAAWSAGREPPGVERIALQPAHPRGHQPPAEVVAPAVAAARITSASPTSEGDFLLTSIPNES
jgi:hypothetical protein